METTTTLAELIERDGITAKAERDDTILMADMPPGSTGWRVTLRRKGPYGGRHSMTVPFGMGPAHVNPPTAQTVLECLLSDADTVYYANGFEDWADTLGYDPDSRTAERTYLSARKLTTKLETFLAGLFDDYLSSEDR